MNKKIIAIIIIISVSACNCKAFLDTITKGVQVGENVKREEC